MTAYTCILKDIGYAVVKFNNIEFLQGVILLHKWLQKDWRGIILNLHYKDEPINNLDSILK